MKGGFNPVAVAAVSVYVALFTDAIVEVKTGKTIVQHAFDGLKEMIDDAVEEGGATGRVDVEQNGVG